VFCFGGLDWRRLDGPIRDAATKAVALIQQNPKSWPSKQRCFSCHQQVLPALAFREARQHGIPLDEAAAHADAARAFGFYLSLDRAVQYTHNIDPAMADSYGLMAADAAGLRPSLVTAVYARLIAARQEADGHWETFDERPPQSYSPFTATAISMAAIQEHSHANLRADVAKGAETVLFGSVADVTHLLDGGFDPNSATKAGGTTTLMLAAPDIDKMKLLAGRGRERRFPYSALFGRSQLPWIGRGHELVA
jgi:hypothetical protein